MVRLGMTRSYVRNPDDTLSLVQEPSERPQPDSLKEKKSIRKPFENLEGNLYLQVRLSDDDMAFVHNQDGAIKLLAKIETPDGHVILPQILPTSETGNDLEMVVLPNEDVAHTDLLSATELMAELKAHINEYVDLAPLDIELCCYYVLFTWFYSKVNTLPYLRFLADTGKGKSRALRIVSDLCFYPIRTSGASSFSGAVRTSQKWMGTMVMDEADLYGNISSQFIKFLNLGFEARQYYVLSDKQNPRKQQYFDPFMPKIIAMRQPFRDNATEARLLSISMRETHNNQIPILLPEEYDGKVVTLQNYIARFVLEHWASVDANQMQSYHHLPIEARLKQLSMPLSIIFHVWPEGESHFEDYIMARQKELKLQRSMSWEGALFNTVLGIANGDLNLEHDFPTNYNEGFVEAVTPTMVSKQMSSTPKTVTIGLQSIGFKLERKRLGSGKETRYYAVPSVQDWHEMLSRYYYSEEGEDIPSIPDILKSKRFVNMCMEPSQVSQVSQNAGNVEVVTDVTDVTISGTGFSEIAMVTGDIELPMYPISPCPVCGSSSFWLRDEFTCPIWVCQTCHPKPKGSDT
jgi:hypothetical protein